MRIRMMLLLVCGMMLAGGLMQSGSFARAALQDATPDAATPTDLEEEAPTDATPAAATPTADRFPDGPLTLVYWYRLDEDEGLLRLSPMTLDGVVGAEGDTSNEALRGRVNFADPRNDDLPRLRLDDNVCDAYPVDPDDPTTAQRWIYFNDDPEARPSTLVMQLVCVRGELDEYEGTATFISQGTERGGVLVVVLNPPGEEEDEE
jgi:hypothetical protein